MFTNVHKSVYDTEDSMVRPEIAVVLALRNLLFPMLSSKLNLGNHERLRIVHYYSYHNWSSYRSEGE
jgi:hypothetical protein